MARDTLGTMLIGVLFGLALSYIGFTSWDQVHAMFALSDPRMTLAFALAIPVLALAWLVIGRLQHPRWAPRSIHKGTVAGGLLFGIGWSLSGACPSIALVQLGEGQLPALWTLLGIFGGNYVYSVVHERYLRWTTGSCLDD